METEFNLSEKISEVPQGLTCACGKCDLSNIKTKYVKEFITTIQVKVLTGWKGQNEFIDWLDKKVGEDLK